MEDDLRSTMNFEFGIVGDNLDLSDDDSLPTQVSVQASKAELQRQQQASFRAWREDTAAQFQLFLKGLVGELQPRRDDFLQRSNIVARLSSALDHMDSLRGATLSTFGSFESNFYSRWADLDLSLELPNIGTLLEPVSINKKLKVKTLNSLSRTLTRKGEAHNVQFIPYARVPLITFEDSRYNISCDISINNDAAILKSRLLGWISEIDSRCRDLVFLVKFWAKTHGINDPKLGTLNSFALCLLVIFHLQTRSPPVLPPLSAVLDEDIARRSKGTENFTEKAMKDCWEKIQPFIADKFGTQNKSSVAELFITFFNQFSSVKELWNQGLAVCTFTGAWGDRSSTCAKWRSKRYMMSIEDPFDRWENCARSVQESTFDSISRAFASTADALCCVGPSTGLPSLLEAVFLWPVDMHAVGLQAWLLKVHSKDGKPKTAQKNKTIMDRSTAVSSAVRTMHGKSQSVQLQHDHHRNIREVPLDAFLEKSVEAQFREQLHLDHLVTAGKPKTKRKKKKVPVTTEDQFREQLHFDHSVTAVNPITKIETKKLPVITEAIAVGGVEQAGSNSISYWRPKNNVHLERMVRKDSRVQAVENHCHQLDDIPPDTPLKKAPVREQRYFNHSAIAGMPKEIKTRNRRAPPVENHPHQVHNISLNTLLEDNVEAPMSERPHVNHSVIASTPKETKMANQPRIARKDRRAQAVENHAHQLYSIPLDTSLENRVEAMVREQLHVNQSVIADTSKETTTASHSALNDL